MEKETVKDLPQAKLPGFKRKALVEVEHEITFDELVRNMEGKMHSMYMNLFSNIGDFSAPTGQLLAKRLYVMFKKEDKESTFKAIEDYLFAKYNVSSYGLLFMVYAFISLITEDTKMPEKTSFKEIEELLDQNYLPF